MRFKASRGGCRLIPRKGVFFAAAFLFLPLSAFAQNAISTGTRAGFRMFYPNSNDWWLDPSAGRFDIRMNGGTAFATLNALGYLGIGTTNPTFALDVNGMVHSNARFQYSDGTRAVYIWAQDRMGLGTSGVLESQTNAPFGILTTVAQPLVFGTLNAEVMRLTSSGGVGIGTTAPNLVGANRALTVSAGTSGNVTSVLELQGAVTTDNNFADVEFYHQGNRVVSLQAVRDGADNKGRFSVVTNDGTSFASRMTVSSAGNVGIGTAGLGEKLEVNGGIKISDAARLYSPGSLAISGTSSSPTQPTNSVVINGGDTSNTPGRGVQIMTSDVAGTPQKRLNFDSGQNFSKAYFQNVNVGIGTTAPGEALEVNGKVIAQDPVAANHVATRGWVLAQAGGGGKTPYVQIFTTTPGSPWTVPSGVNVVWVTMVGGGGGGGAQSYGWCGQTRAGGGGGGGRAYFHYPVSVTPGASISVGVGGGGAGGSYSSCGTGLNGQVGGDSNFGSLIAKGGTGSLYVDSVTGGSGGAGGGSCSGGIGGANASGQFNGGNAPGAGGDGFGACPGGGGGGGYYSAGSAAGNGGNGGGTGAGVGGPFYSTTYAGGGGGGSSSLGTGGNGGYYSSIGQISATVGGGYGAGGGGGGGYSYNNGAAGSTGVVIIEWVQ